MTTSAPDDVPAKDGLHPKDQPAADATRLRRLGIDPGRLSRHRFGRPQHALWRGYPRWGRRLALGVLLWAAIVPIERAGWVLPSGLRAIVSLVIGLLILQGACDALLTATERLAARKLWDHYVAGTVSEIVSTIPEFVVIAFVVPVSPVAALVIALVTIYNNALVFSLYSYFLPKDQKGRFLMPAAITEAGTQILTAGAAMGSVIGLVMLVLSAQEHPKEAFSAMDLALLGILLLIVFVVYLHKLLTEYASEETAIREALDLGETQIRQRQENIYEDVKQVSMGNIVWLLAIGIVGAVLGGERVSEVAQTAISELALDPIATAVVLAGFAGMSEYVIVWRAHWKKQYRIALANAFGGITQVMFLVFPYTLLVIAGYQAFMNPAHPELPLQFTLSSMLLLALLFPVFFVLIALLEEDHTFGLLDTTVMVVIFVLVLSIIVAYGG